MSKQKSQEVRKGAGFFRRLAAYIYDAFMVIAVAMVVVMLSLGLLALASAVGLVTIPEGLEHSSYLTQQVWFQVAVWGSVIAFYLWFWAHAGQTVGMRAWRLRVQNKDGSNISYAQACIRLFTAAFGLGNLMVLVTRDNSAFQDMWAKCEVIELPKKA